MDVGGKGGRGVKGKGESGGQNVVEEGGHGSPLIEETRYEY